MDPVVKEFFPKSFPKANTHGNSLTSVKPSEGHNIRFFLSVMELGILAAAFLLCQWQRTF